MFGKQYHYRRESNSRNWMLHWLSRFNVVIPHSPSEKIFSSTTTERAHSRSLAGFNCAWTFVLLPFSSVLRCTLFCSFVCAFSKQQHLRSSYKPLRPQRRLSHITAHFLYTAQSPLYTTNIELDSTKSKSWLARAQTPRTKQISRPGPQHRCDEPSETAN
jgi:hypothetical protein